MILVLGIDLETTNPEEGGHITELAACLWDVEAKRLIRTYSALVELPEGADYPEDVQRLTHLTRAQVDAFSQAWETVINQIRAMAIAASYIVAHNGEFEKRFLGARENGQVFVESLPWIDTMTDLPLPSYYQGSRGLGALAYERGLHNPFPHCALGDVMVMLQLLSSYPFHLTEKAARSPQVRLIASVSFDNKDLAKAQGFRWDGTTKSWFKDAKEMELEELIPRCNFVVFRQNEDGTRTNASIEYGKLVG